MRTDKRKKDISMRAHLWAYFCTFAICIMLILWVLQIFFLNTFFKTMKLHELERIGSEILAQYKLEQDDSYDFWYEHSFNSGIFANIVSESGKVVGFNSSPRFENSNSRHYRPHPEAAPFLHNEFFERFIESVTKSNSGKTSYVETNNINKTQFAVYGSYIGTLDGEKLYLYLLSPLERTDSTRKVLQTQLIIVTFLSVLLALILAYFIAKRLSKPIEKITESAHALADGNYGVEFKKGTYREINELAETLNRTSCELSKTENLRKDLISNISHDLRTPLTIIKSYAEMIRDISGGSEEKRNAHTGVIIDEANRLSLLVNDLLDLSRMQAGTITMEIKPFDLNQTVKSTMASFELYSEKEGYNFKVNLSATHRVLGDERRIEQVIYNLIGNAINYTGEDRVVYVNVCDNGSKVLLSVEDTGNGIPQDELDRVWDKYYKSADTHSRQEVGTGIGLSIVKNILCAHGASYGVESKMGSGSKFWFELPCAD